MTTFLDGRLELQRFDISRLELDAIVNPAHSSLTVVANTGIDFAIHRAAGPGLQAECAQLGGCRTGQAKITRGHGLPAKFVIHAVGPVWQGGDVNEELLLGQTYRNALALAVQHGITTIAFPWLSVAPFPQDRAAEIAVKEIVTALRAQPTLKRVVLCCPTNDDLDVYERVARRWFS